MRIQVISGHGSISGGEQMLLRVTQAMRELGHQPIVVGPAWGELSEVVSRSGLEYRAVGGATRRTYAAALGVYMARRHRSLIWANGALPALSASLTRDPLVIHLHQRQTRRQTRTLSVATRRARKVVVPSEFMVTQVPGSVSLRNWTRELPLRDQGPGVVNDPGDQSLEIGYVGRLSLDKGVDVLAEAITKLASGALRHRRLRLLVAGDYRFVAEGQERAVRTALARLPVEVVSLGWSDPLVVYRTADVCVVPSRWQEPFGLTAAEAMAIGCPLVVSNAGALPEVVGDDYPWIFNSGQPLALAAAVNEVLTSDTGLTVARARLRWRDEFSPDVGRRRLERLLTSMNKD